MARLGLAALPAAARPLIICRWIRRRL